MTKAASQAQLASLSPVQLAALQFMPIAMSTLAFFMIASVNGYLA